MIMMMIFANNGEDYSRVRSNDENHDFQARTVFKAGADTANDYDGVILWRVNEIFKMSSIHHSREKKK